MNKISEEITHLLRTAVNCMKQSRKRKTAAIIVSAGNGTRFDKFGGITKQMASLEGIPVIVRTVLVFEECDIIDEIIIVARENEMQYYDEFSQKYNFKKVKSVVCGGATRQISALKGFDAISPDTEFVAIHDGARCLVTSEMIKKVADEAYIHGAAAAASRSHNTIKMGSEENFIENTIDRNFVWLVQTPQIFAANIYRAAAYTAKEENVEATDDCMLVERLGFKIKLVDCGYENIKITVPFDMYLAEAILNHRGEREGLDS